MKDTFLFLIILAIFINLSYSQGFLKDLSIRAGWNSGLNMKGYDGKEDHGVSVINDYSSTYAGLFSLESKSGFEIEALIKLIKSNHFEVLFGSAYKFSGFNGEFHLHSPVSNQDVYKDFNENLHYLDFNFLGRWRMREIVSPYLIFGLDFSTPLKYNTELVNIINELNTNYSEAEQFTLSSYYGNMYFSYIIGAGIELNDTYPVCLEVKYVKNFSAGIYVINFKTASKVLGLNEYSTDNISLSVIVPLFLP